MVPPHYFEQAASDVDVDELGDIPSDPVLALEHCESLAAGRGWTLLKKGAEPGTSWGDFTTTFGTELPVIFLSKKWDSLAVDEKALIACHEIVHTFTWERMGSRKFLPTYLINEGLWSIEVPAYRLTLTLWAAFNSATAGEIRAEARRLTNVLFDKYGLKRMPECMRARTEFLLYKDLLPE